MMIKNTSTRNLKLAFFFDELAPGSAPKLIGWPVRRLSEIGVDAEAVVIIEKDHWKKHKEHYDSHLAGVKVRYLFPKFPKFLQKMNFKFPGMSFFSLHHIASWLFAHRAVDFREFDIVVANCQYSAFAARNTLRLRDIPFLQLIWDPATFTAEKIYKKRMGWKYPFLYLAAKVLDRFAFQKCRAVITSGEFHHKHVRGITDKPFEILYPGCFVREDLPAFSSRERMIVTYDRWDIGNIPVIFLDMLEQLDHKDVSLTIGGFWHPESLREEFTQEIEKRGLQSRVHLRGSLNEKDIMELCSRAMVHVHPVHEAFGMQTLEAAGCGCPGIIPAGSGAAELFEHGKSGFHPPIGDLKSMVGCINTIFSDPKLAEKMSRAAFEAAKKHTWLEYAKKLKTICRKYSLKTNGK
ncbi:glycosyltransferase family 4 protein [Elusimicrobiota bacterium]